MNKKISTRVGLTTGLGILAYILLLRNINLTEHSPLILVQFLLLLTGIVISCFLLYRYYADIKFLDAFTHCVKTAITALIIVITGYAILFLLFENEKTFSKFTTELMITIFTYCFSGLLSAFFTSLIFNTFTKNK